MTRLLTIFLLFSSINIGYSHDLDEDEIRYAQSLMQSISTIRTPGSYRLSGFKMPASGGRLNNDYTIKPFETKASQSAIIKAYIILGFKHILPKGLDHILFILGLFLFSILLRPLIYQVTAFTLAHSVTLALSVYGVFTIPSSIIEPLIAISIVYVAIENIYKPKIGRWRPLIVFAFGLLHGLGFAGVLLELGLPKQDYLTGLISFNFGVELGQLAIISIAWLLLHKLYSRHWYRNRVVIPCSTAIALVGFYWAIERIFISS